MGLASRFSVALAAARRLLRTATPQSALSDRPALSLMPGVARLVVCVVSALALLVVSLAVVFAYDARPALAQDDATPLLEACKPRVPTNPKTFVSKVESWRDEPSQDAAQVLAWKRVLVAVGEDAGVDLTPMTFREASSNRRRWPADAESNQRWFTTAQLLSHVERHCPPPARESQQPEHGVQASEPEQNEPEENLVCQGQQAAPPARVDYDSDDDGLIEVCTARQFKELRWDPDGDGTPGWILVQTRYGGPRYTPHQGWHTAFPRAAEGMGCPSSGCAGYELAANLNLNGDYGVSPIGFYQGHFWSTTFEGNGHTVKHVRPGTAAGITTPFGVFGQIDSSGVVRNLTLEHVEASSHGRWLGALAGVNRGTVSNVHVIGPRGVDRWGLTGRVADGFWTTGGVGGLVGLNEGVIAHSSSTGQVGGPINNYRIGHNVGGLVARNDGSIRASWSTSSVYAVGVHNVGGLVGLNSGSGSITASYATGDVWHGDWFKISNKWIEQPMSRYMGGLVGTNGGKVAASYSTGRVTLGQDMGGLAGRNTGTVTDSYWDTKRSVLRTSAAGAGKTTAALKRPTGYDGIYANWNVDLDGDDNADDPWHFGTQGQYPIMQNQVTGEPVPVKLVGAVGDFELEAGLSRGFSPWTLFGGDVLAVTAVSSDEAVLSATASPDSLTVVGVAAGSATVTVTAEDASGGTASDEFEVTVLKRHAALIAEIYQWRNDPDHAGDKAYTDRWDRVLLALGETISDSSLTPMTAAEAEALGDEGSDIRWHRVFSPLLLIERNRAEQANRAPIVLTAIDDQTIASPSGTAQVALARVFVDPDHERLTITAASSDDNVATVEVSSDGSSLTITAKAQGAATVTVTADDGNGGTVSDSFTVTVKSTPTVASALADISGLAVGVAERARQRHLPGVADGDTLAVTATSDDDGIATVTVAADGSALTVGGVSAGEAVITVTARDRDGHRATDFFDVEVVAGSGQQESPRPSLLEACAAHLPHNALTAAEVVGWRDAHLHDSAHVLRWNRVLAALGEDVPAGVTALTVAESQDNERRFMRTRWARVTATLQALDACRVAAQQPQDPPNQDPPNQPLLEACAAHLPQSALSAAEVVGWRDAHLHDSAHVLRWNRVLAAFGEDVPVGVTALTTAESQANERRFMRTRWARVTATLQALDTCVAAQQPQDPPGQDPPPANQAPTVAVAIADAVIVHERGAKRVSLSGVFADADSDALTVTAASSDNAVATVSVSAGGATLTVTARSRGTATVTVAADDGNGGTVSDSFTVTVKAAPGVASPLADMALQEGDDREVSLAGVFADADGDALTLTTASSDETVANAFAGFHDDLSVIALQAGTATITVRAEDADGNWVEDAFTVTVAAAPSASQAQSLPPNRAPAVAAPLPDLGSLQAGTTREVSLTGVFDDPDGDSLTVTAASSDTAAADVSVASDGASLMITASAQGAATITVTADDGNGGTVTDTFEVTVTAPPAAQPDQSDIVARYDADGDGKNDSSEWGRARNDFAAGTITYAQLLEVIQAYLKGSG